MSTFDMRPPRDDTTPRRETPLARALPSYYGAAAALVAAAAISTALLARGGLSPISAAIFSAGVFGTATWMFAQRLSRQAEIELTGLANELESGRDRAEARETLLRTVVEATPVALLFYGDAGDIRFANAEARRLFFEGASPEGQNFLRLVSEAPEGLRRALLGDSDELFNVEISGQRETYHLSRRTLPFDGETHTLLLVRQLTFEISRREVDVLRKVIGIISHELDDSLAPISSLIHSSRIIAKNPAHLDELDRVFDTIEERTTHLSAFLNGYAVLARLPKPRPAAIDMTEFRGRLRDLFPGVRIASAPGFTAWFDAGQVEQVLIHLLQNASEAGGDSSAVELEITPEADGALTFRVSDRGKGLTPEALESAFLPLYTTKENGTGMGLALCREVAEAHGDRISLTNRPGGGCVALLWLPAQRRSGGDDTSRSTLTLTRS
jgi:nitrogen fixation/metabolism regulation signal transduction histidine kinase